MKDRYGVDEITYLVGMVSMFVALIGSIFDVDPLLWLSIAGILLALARAFSKNIDARSRENEAFLAWASHVPMLQSLIERINMGSTHASSTQGKSSRSESKRNAAANASTQAGKDELKRQKSLLKKMWKQHKTHAFLKCPQCGQVLSVPKGKGKLIVTCPKCHAKMETKS